MFKNLATAFVLSCLTCLSAAPAMACLPPPPGYIEWNSFAAITLSTDVRSKVGNLGVTEIKLISGSEYLVVAGMCSLHVTVDTKRPYPNAPCGGPIDFVAVPAASMACTQ